jgi:hypothetical protein
MPPLAQIQTEQIDLLQLIDQSPSLSEEQKAYWKKKAGTLTPEQQKQLAQIFLDEKTQREQAEQERQTAVGKAVEEFVQNVGIETNKAKKNLWKAAEDVVKKDEEKEEDDVMHQLQNL